MMAVITSRFGFSTQDLWYASRGTGLVLLVLLSISVSVGILVRSGVTPGRTLRFVVEGVHRNIALICVVLLVIHVVTAELDPYVTIGWFAAIVPFISPYRTLWIGLGAVALDVFAAVIITSLLRRYLSKGVWRAVHLLTYASWPVAFAHSLESGTDTRIAWVLAVMWSCTALVVGSTAYRLLASRPGGRWSRRAVEEPTAAPATVAIPQRGDLRPLDPVAGSR